MSAIDAPEEDDKPYFATCQVDEETVKIAIINPNVETLSDGSTALTMTLKERGMIALLNDMIQLLAKMKGVKPFPVSDTPPQPI